MSTGIVLIHGAGLGSFTWNDLKPKLDYPSLAVNFPNRGKLNKTNKYLSFEDYSERVVNQVKKWNMDKLVIVGHSIGGCIGLKVAEHFKSNVIGFAGISATIPENGGSFVSCLPFLQKLFMPLMLRLAGTLPPPGVIEKKLCNDLTREETKMIVNKFTAESRCLFTDDTNAIIPATLKMYIQLTNDHANPLKLQDKMADNLKAHHVVKLQSGHLPMISRPAALADILNRFCAEAEQTGFTAASSAA